LFLALAMVLLIGEHEATAQGETDYDLVNAVNSLRAIHGLEPYQIDPWLMAYAQEHSEYQARLQSGTHLHSDGTLPWENGIQENVAGGDEGIVTVYIVVNEIWVDWGHRHVLTGYASGEIGTGLARGENGQIYYTVDIRPAEGIPTVVPQPGMSASFVPYTTSTPDAEGAIFHVAGPGEALWSIAISYGVKVDEIRRLNGIPGDSTVIQVGQKLLIRPASQVTPVTSVTPSPSATRKVTTLTRTATVSITPTRTSFPSMTSTPSPISPADGFTLVDMHTAGVVGLVITAIGFLVVIYFGFRRR